MGVIIFPIQSNGCIKNVIKSNLNVVVYILTLQIGKKRKKATINLKEIDNKCFQYTITLPLNYEEIKNPERVLNIKPCTNRYICNRKIYPSKIDDSKTFEKNNSTSSLYFLFIKEKKICPAYISKIN